MILLGREGKDEWVPIDSSSCYCSTSAYDAASPILNEVLAALQSLNISVDQVEKFLCCSYNIIRKLKHEEMVLQNWNSRIYIAIESKHEDGTSLQSPFIYCLLYITSAPPHYLFPFFTLLEIKFKYILTILCFWFSYMQNLVMVNLRLWRVTQAVAKLLTT